MNEIAEAWEERYKGAAAEIAEVESHGLMAVPYNLAVTTEKDAAFVVGAIQLRRGTAERIKAQANAMAAQIERDADRLETHFAGQLEGYTREHLVGKAKSIKIVTGQGGEKLAVMGFRTVRGGLRIEDKEKALDWGGEQENELDFVNVKTTYAPIAAAFKKHFETTGEMPAGCLLKDDTESFTIK